MALSESDVELIRASWVRARSDPIDAGVLLFKGLFTKFPDYLRLFNQFEDLDLERIQEHKRLVKHAVKVIETVTFVVDSIGDPTKGDQLNEALVSLVRGHAKRAIGLKEFQNLGIVLIDFICDLNNRRVVVGGCLMYNSANCARLMSASDSAATTRPAAFPARRGCTSSSTSSSQDSGTMTSTLDKIRASLSPSSSCSDDDINNIISRHTLADLAADEPATVVASFSAGSDNVSHAALEQQAHHQHQHLHHHHHHHHNSNSNNSNNKYLAQEDYNANVDCPDPDGQRLLQDSAAKPVKLDTGQLVVAWKKLYKIILDLVRAEEAALA